MLPRGKIERRWRKAAEAAMAPERLAAERELIAAELARRLWVANGGAAWASVDSEGSLLALETLVTRYVGPGILRASAGLKHLQRIEETLHGADYEDIPALRAEMHWAEGYLTEMIFADGLGASPQRDAGETGSHGAPEEPESAVKRLEELYQELAVLVQAELKAAEIAA